jgi:hypothetical protein
MALLQSASPTVKKSLFSGLIGVVRMRKKILLKKIFEKFCLCFDLFLSLQNFRVKMF